MHSLRKIATDSPSTRYSVVSHRRFSLTTIRSELAWRHHRKPVFCGFRKSASEFPRGPCPDTPWIIPVRVLDDACVSGFSHRTGLEPDFFLRRPLRGDDWRKPSSPHFFVHHREMMEQTTQVGRAHAVPSWDLSPTTNALFLS